MGGQGLHLWDPGPALVPPGLTEDGEKALATKSPEILRTERTAAPSSKVRLGSVQNAGTLSFAPPSALHLGLSREGHGDMGGAEGHPLQVSLSNPVRRPHGNFLLWGGEHPHADPPSAPGGSRPAESLPLVLSSSPHRQPPTPTFTPLSRAPFTRSSLPTNCPKSHSLILLG